MDETTQSTKRARRAQSKASEPARPAKGESGVTRIDPNERLQLIRTAAYYRAERRGFGGGSDLEDWLAAEAEVDAMLSAVSVPRRTSRAKKSPAN